MYRLHIIMDYVSKQKWCGAVDLKADFPAHYLFESGEFGRVLYVPQAGVLSCQLLSDAFVLWMLRGQDQARVVTQLPQVLQRLKECRHEGKH